MRIAQPGAACAGRLATGAVSFVWLQLTTQNCNASVTLVLQCAGPHQAGVRRLTMRPQPPQPGPVSLKQEPGIQPDMRADSHEETWPAMPHLGEEPGRVSHSHD